KLDALAQVAGGLAHELNDSLAVVIGQAGLLLDDEETSPRQAGGLQRICQAGEHAAGLLRQLLIFSGQLELRLQVLTIDSLLHETAPALRRLAGDAVALEFQLAPKVPPILADAGMVEQLLLELVANAREAMPGGGTVAIRTKRREIGAEEMTVEAGARPGTYLRLEVADAGCGLVPEVRRRLFEPFFTTKGGADRRGLGLATVWGIAQRHGGWVTVESMPGAGTTFAVHLPAVPPGSEASSLPRCVDRTGGAKATVLLVEDEAPVREVTAACLQAHGYRVLQASSGREALEVWKWHAPRIALLLTDHLLHGDMTGLDLAARLQADKPELSVICITGAVANPCQPIGTASREPCDPGAARGAVSPAADCLFLRKPCRPQTLIRAVKNSLEQERR
ncbi:MAG: response regulator, partial [Verrucomicrobia bacterium]|nr:response regulator [Verrucomicrobiota bacterium]